MFIDILGYSGSIQTMESANSSFLIRSETTSILVDVSGSPCKSLLEVNQNPDLLDAVAITHAHVDHLYAFPSLLHNLWMRKRKKPLFIIGNSHTLQVAKDLISLFLLDKKKDLMEILVWNASQSQVGNITIESFPLFHRPLVPTNGFSFSMQNEKVSYFPDSAAQEPYPSCSFGSQLVIHEAVGLDSERDALNSEGHSSGYQAGLLAKSIRAKQLLLMHLPGDEGLQRKIGAEAASIFSNTLMPMDNRRIIL